MKHTKQTNSGFTLIELMVTLSIAAILLTVAVPNFSSMLRNNRSTTQANELVSAMNLARSEAAKRGIRTSVCPRSYPATSPETCTGSNSWTGGWLVFTDGTGTAGVFDSTDILLRIAGAVEGSPVFTSTKNSVQYRSTGSVTTSTSFTLTPQSCSNTQQRSIAISASGRATTKSESC